MPLSVRTQLVLGQALALIALAGWAAAPSETPAPVAPPVTPPVAPPSPAPTIDVPGEFPEATLVLLDGRTFTGLLISRDEQKYVIRIAGIDTTFAASKVDRCQVLEPVLERYKRLRAAIDDNDADQLMQLADFLMARDRLGEALAEMQALAARQPGNPDVRAKLVRIEQLVDLRASQNETPGTAPAAVEPVDTTKHPVPLLTPEQVNLLKVFEIDLDRDPGVLVPRQVAEAVFTKFAGDPLVPPTKEARDALLREGSGKMLELMFRLRAREFYTQVKVLQTPEPLKRFREDVQQTLLLSGCATSGCHGGVSAGRFIVATQRPMSEQTSLTNFYIVSRFKLASGKGLIDFENPTRSALIQLGLPRDQSTTPHPPVPNPETGADQWRPAIRSKTDPRLKQLTGWISSLFQPRPTYELNYKPLKAWTAEGERVDGKGGGK